MFTHTHIKKKNMDSSTLYKLNLDNESKLFFKKWTGKHIVDLIYNSGST